MAVSVNTPADVINASLAKMGYKMRISDPFDGSLAAKKALDLYGETRDALLASRIWPFARRYAAAVASGQTAPLPWAFEWNYPSDGIRILEVFNTVYTGSPTDPVPTVWTDYDDAVAGKTILTQIGSVTLLYTARVTDPTKWVPGFTDALIGRLAKRMSKLLVDVNLAKLEMADDTPEAEMEDAEEEG